MSKIALSGNPSGTGTFTIASPNSNTDRTVNLPDAGGDMVLTTATQTLTNKTLQSSTIQGGAITLATAVTASGTSVDFTGIPSWVKRITVMFRGVSTNGSSPVMVQLGDAGGFETTGYSGSVDYVEDNSVGTTFSTGFLVDRSLVASNVRTGQMTICAFGSNIWNETSTISDTLVALLLGAGDKALSDTLDRIRITTVNGTDTFDAGTINIMYEG
jgi:hypothetical protein